ncbi:MAG: PAQR family membrane homeostasis protein TrhA [Sinimarinibacterium flocculans]|uniref:PAQR family membrane homeostasis protein TrhA n=1 Tax=Sinimarinibacterium flocculans TaxID=985250 RepID=UPI00249281AB|nr:hemolysin III family protein [Sinimarinibacterium flocculans]MEC9364309.1 hemolysin III family protein [Pseudomonadota bacterium]
MAPRSRWRSWISEQSRQGLGHPHEVLGVHVPDKLYSLGEEIAHASTHGLGVVLSIVGLTVLVARASLYGDAWHITAVSIFGATLVLMYTASTLYHSIPLPRTKRVLRVIDHSLIYFLIAGTYTPFTLVTLHGPWGWSLFGVTWGLAIAGVGFKILATGKFEKLSLAIYLGMGWCAIAAVKPLLQNLETGGLILMLAGGLVYSGGVAFYVWEKLRYHHAIWHLFVLAGSILHFFAVLFYVVPGPQ